MAISKRLQSGLENTTLTGTSMVGGVSPSFTDEFSSFQKKSPIDGEFLGDVSLAEEGQIEQALTLAEEAFWQDTVVKPIGKEMLARMLTTVSVKLGEKKEDLRLAYGLETALPSTEGGRFDGEFARTCGQLIHMATRVRKGTQFVPVIDTETPFGTIAKTMQGIGPVLVLGAINFPLAFSTAGGDFADALASGCPVIVKAHPEHPFTSEIVAQCIAAAIKECGVHEGWFSHIHCSVENTQRIMKDPRIKAGALTGSLGAAVALKKIADERHVPFFAECGGNNPVFVSPEYLEGNAAEFAQQLFGSITMGVGQFCTKPGIVVLTKGKGLAMFQTELKELAREQSEGTMLSKGTKTNFLAGVAELLAIDGMEVLIDGGSVEHDTKIKPKILEISAADLLKSPEYCQCEAFGPSTVIVVAENMDEVFEVAKALHGSLTATRFGTEAELSAEQGQRLKRILQIKAGRVISNGMPTGVAVVPGMNHGGPFPACTIDSSSVGGSTRFLRAVTFQNESFATMPLEVSRGDHNRQMRLVNGQFTDSRIPKPDTSKPKA